MQVLFIRHFVEAHYHRFAHQYRGRFEISGRAQQECGQNVVIRRVFFQIGFAPPADELGRFGSSQRDRGIAGKPVFCGVDGFFDRDLGLLKKLLSLDAAISAAAVIHPDNGFRHDVSQW